MPTYEYRCPEGHDFEHFFPRISDAATSLPCPTCGAGGQRRISAGGGLLFKGSGFYITDYGKDGKKDLRARADKTKDGTKTPAGSAGEGRSGGGDSTGGSPSAPSAPATSGTSDA